MKQLNQDEEFIQKCAQMDFDKAGMTQERVWNRITSTPVVWRSRRVLAGCVCGLFFVVGAVFSNWMLADKGQQKEACVSQQTEKEIPAESLWVCVLDKKDSQTDNFYCWENGSVKEEGPASESTLYKVHSALNACKQQRVSQRKCMEPFYPPLPSFYDFCEEC